MASDDDDDGDGENHDDDDHSDDREVDHDYVHDCIDHNDDRDAMLFSIKDGCSHVSFFVATAAAPGIYSSLFFDSVKWV